MEERSIIAFGFASGLIFLALIFLWNLWLAPYRITGDRINALGQLIQRNDVVDDQQEVIRMMRAVMMYYKKNFVLDPDYEESANRATMLCDKLTEKGLAPSGEHSDEYDKGWPDYLNVMLPYVEEYGVTAAQDATRELTT